MRLLGTRRAALVAGAATVAAVALAGCSAGQVAETALKKPSNMGVNADTTDGSVAIRNLAVVYPGPEGYPAGGNAPLEVFMSNQTTSTIVVTISTRPDPDATPQDAVVSGRMVGLGGGESEQPAEPSVAPEPSEAVEPSALPSAPATQPARITLQAQGYQSFMPGDPEQVVVMDLADRMIPGSSVNLVFEFSNGAPALTLRAPMTVPLSPAPRESGEGTEHGEGE